MKTFLFLLSAIASIAVAEDPDMSIVVEGHSGIDIYVAPIAIVDMSEHVDIAVNKNATFGLASSHRHLSKSNLPINVYDKHTISYVWEECDYNTQPKKCAYDNAHYLLETTITLSNEQFVVEMLLFNHELQIVARGIWSDKSIIRWIKQQETVMTVDRQDNVTINSKKEDLPLKWVIPSNALHDHLYQASLGLWVGAKL